MVCQSTLPFDAFNAHTLPDVVPVTVPSTACSPPLPSMSASAGLPPVNPSRVVLQTWLHFVS